jgi:hypothetical protein
MFYNLIKQSTLQMGMCEDKKIVGKPGHGGRYVCVDKIHRDNIHRRFNSQNIYVFMVERCHDTLNAILFSIHRFGSM